MAHARANEKNERGSFGDFVAEKYSENEDDPADVPPREATMFHERIPECLVTL